MRRLLRRIPQLQRLAVFDAVASAGGFTSAASDLGVSQPAVSRHIAQLERQLGVALFERTGGTIETTEQGRRLADGVAAAFDAIERALDDVGERTEALVFAVQPAMATTWIVPALDALEELTATPIRLRIFDRSSELERDDWDLAVVPGQGTWPGWQGTLLFHEAVRPLASPGFAETHGLGGDTDPSALVGVNLLHIDEHGRPSMTWREWFEAAAGDRPARPIVPPAPRVVYDTYSTALHEALVGHGVALGWRHLIGDLVHRGLLVPVGPLVRHGTVGHHLCWRRGRLDPRFAAVADELLRRVAADRDPLD